MASHNGQQTTAEAELTPQSIAEHASRKMFQVDGRFWLALAGLALLVALGIIGFVIPGRGRWILRRSPRAVGLFCGNVRIPASDSGVGAAGGGGFTLD